MKVLLIEDEPLIQKSLAKLMAKRGAEVQTTGMGEQAIKMILTQSFDRIICDLMLQDISGFDVLESAKKKYRPDQIRDIFIIITAYSSPQVLTKAERYQCKVISKPFGDIAQTIDIFLNSERIDNAQRV